MVIKAGIMYKHNSPLLWWRPRWTPYVYTLTNEHDLQACDVHSGNVVAVVALADCQLAYSCVKSHADIEWSECSKPKQTNNEGLPWRLRLDSSKRFRGSGIVLAMASERDWVEWIEALKSIPSMTTTTNDKVATTSSTDPRRSSSCTTHRTATGRNTQTILLKSAINQSLEQYEPTKPTRSTSVK
ncbi:hypothetical protein AaE_003746 [Aphanomyces astaci]|uniref:PH domain-containing protein n=1 Tax=Aphanomyces astaci TaxID=112090 RepID=A0A6A5ACC0_APHAT|nr:hypothetical protein AaE_003746 [Aphanomyces astaci]